MKKITVTLASLMLVLFTQVAYAGGLTLNMIGELDVSGTSYTQYWYTGSNPNLSGEAPAGNVVTLTVNGEEYGTTTADSNGVWNHQVILNEGDNTISISTEGMDPYTFTLTKGAPPEGTGGMVPSDMPAAGNGSYTMLFMSMGVIALATSFVVLRKV